ncbi:MAG: exodeoxyribonuclease III [Kiritimatiellae bacterium]|nr:exodeoxyribonuclease III [Kiritimatiellia bacterium]
MKIATFNANSIRSRLDIVLDWLKQYQPDILCVQETKVVDELFPRDPIEEAGYHVHFKGQKAYNGVALFSRETARNIRCGFDDGGLADESRLIRATIGPITVVNTYIPQGREIDHEMYTYKLEWFKRLRAYFERHFTAEDDLIWMGDINVAAEAIDIHNADRQENHVCYHKDVRAAFSDCRKWGFVDVFRVHHPEAGHYTYYDYRTPNAVKRGMGWRIDYILASTPLANRCKNAYIDLEPRLADRPSDHTFLVADIDL